LLARLAQQARLTVVTTHYPELKEWASGRERAANAATAIDPETHRPLYRLALGRAGTSHALQTAERLGLDAAVVARAHEAVDPERRQISTLLSEAERAERAAAEAHDAARAERAAAEAAKEELQKREAELGEEVERVRASAQAERERARVAAEQELAAARRELDELRRDIRAAKRAQRDEPARDRRLGSASERAASVERELRRLAEPLPVTAPLAVGDPVEAPGIGVRGTIVEIDGDEAEVAGAGGQRVRIALARLRPSAARDVQTPSAVSIRATAATRATDQLDVRGSSAQDAREAVRALVDAAAVAGMRDVHVIHGRGTGVLKRAVREELRRHPLVHEIEAESADGATIARLS
jgi:DNA mismatch repair protein MutS2